MSAIVGLLVVGPILASAAGLLARDRERLRDAITLLSLVASTAASSWLLVAVEADGPVVVRVGGWIPELGIVLVADLFAALILVVAVATILVVEVFAITQRRTAWGADPRLAGPDPAGPDGGGVARLPHRRPVHPLRRLRDDPRVQLRAVDPSGPAGPDPGRA